MDSELIGYTDKFSVTPGERLHFMVSTTAPTYRVTLVRLIHADSNPNGPGLKEEIVESRLEPTYPGRRQIACCGSYVVVEDSPELERLSSITLQAWIYPTTPRKGEPQGLIAQWSSAVEAGFGIFLGEQGDLQFWLGDGTGHVERICTGKPVRPREWCFVAAVYDASKREASVYQLPQRAWPEDSAAAIVRHAACGSFRSHHRTPLLIAAASLQISRSRKAAGQGIYNGKIDSPCILSRALAPSEVESLRQGLSPAEVDREAVVAAWDFSADMGSHRVSDSGPHRLHGRAINMPARAMTGHNWTARNHDPKAAPNEYGAIHFHDDDLEDAGWEADFAWEVPEGLRSGIYAARLNSADREDYVPFVVRPKRGQPAAPVAVLLPSLTYLAYANQRIEITPDHASGVRDRELRLDPLDDDLAAHRELGMSIYDRHRDGSGCCYSSRLRPIIGLRPNYRYWLVGAPRHFAADLYLIDWLENKGFVYDVFTDEDLHFEGKGLLQQYPVVLTGTHPEYTTAAMLDALQEYLDEGGHLMYLGGNGFYWVASLDPGKPHVMEVRRGMAGSRDWSSAHGECYHSTTGELGGHWRFRGRPPNALVGVGFTAMGWDGAAPGYSRKPGSFDPRAAFIFEGIAANETIGDFGLVLGGAAGDELDRLDYALGTPAHTLLLASSSGHSRFVLPVIEDFTQINAGLMTGDHGANVRADMVYFETPREGGVFSTGSITWCGSLSHNRYDNNVSRITENVLKQFLAGSLQPRSEPGS
ncbi:MAG: LamG domain-containing protein [Acidimicrobiia bacterium]|nr:LamG domain-containing protein [Acidimicrobiia bacterium]